MVERISGRGQQPVNKCRGMKKGIIREDRGYVSTLLINRPEKRNSLNASTLFDLGDTLREIEKENSTRVIVLRGVGKKAFSSGVDISGGQKEFRRTIEGLEYCVDSLIDYPQPVISMIYGPAIGAGMDIAVISDFRIAAESAAFGVPLVKLGRTYYYKQIERLTRLIGLAAAREMLLTGRLIYSKRAKEIGLVNQVVDDDKLEFVVDSLAREIAEETSPVAVKATKLTIKKLFEETHLAPALEEELRLLAEKVNQTEDAKEGVRARMEKRRPVFTGR